MVQNQIWNQSLPWMRWKTDERGNPYAKGSFGESRGQIAAMEVPDADIDAWYLLSYVTGLDRAAFFLHGEEPMGGAGYDSILRPGYKTWGTHSITAFDR